MSSERRIFVSHSRDDVEGRLFVHDLFLKSGFAPDFYPLENKGPPHAEPIRDRIREATSVFVLLSPPMAERRHTRAWVGYEVGIAAERGLPVVVIEPEGGHVNLPVPGATHYLRRPQSALGGLSPAWRHIAKTGGLLVDREWSADAETLGEKVLEFLYNAATADKDTSGLFTRAICEFKDCRSRFYVPDSLFGSDRVPCPSCRTEVASLRVQLAEMTEKAVEAAERAEGNSRGTTGR
jgi:hypothetical protein